MPQRMSATYLSRHLSEVLDAVEHRGESFTIERHGRSVAKIEAEPAKPNGRELREYFDSLEPDPDLADALEEAYRWSRSLPARNPWAD